MSVPCKIGPVGEIVALGRRYWAPELADKAGWDVELHFDPDDEMYPSVWTRARQQRLGTAMLIASNGFLVPEAAQAKARQLRERRASIVRFQVAESLRILDERFQRAGESAKPIGAQPGHGGQGGILRRLRNAWGVLFQTGELSGQQTTHGVDLDLEKLQALFLHGEALFDGHSDAPVVQYGWEPNAAKCAAHSKIEGEK